MIHARRIHTLRPGEATAAPVIYWMSRDQRVQDNWALLHAQSLAWSSPLGVVFCLAPEFLGAPIRAYAFMLAGLREVEKTLAAKNIAFFLLTGDPGQAVPRFVRRVKAGMLVTDFDPLRIKRQWQRSVTDEISIPFFEVDAHNVVPCRWASAKQEFGAYTLRPKLHRLLPEFLEEFPPLKRHPVAWPQAPAVDWDRVGQSVTADRSVGEIAWLKPGEGAARKALKHFINHGLAKYPEHRNDPTQDGQSNLSPYLHFGQIAAQRVAREVLRAAVPVAAREAFLEELIVRRELADNYCFHNADYDRFEGLPEWARRTLNAHRNDPRSPRYTHRQLEQAATHDELWNAAQVQMMRTGKMHGYLRMYWAKKILEWTATPREALAIAIALNDRYELDGRDPNGYTGIAWSIGGLHDRPWRERPVFGKIRYMSLNGCRGKFDVDAFVKQYV